MIVNIYSIHVLSLDKAEDQRRRFKKNTTDKGSGEVVKKRAATARGCMLTCSQICFEKPCGLLLVLLVSILCMVVCHTICLDGHAGFDISGLLFSIPVFPGLWGVAARYAGAFRLVAPMAALSRPQLSTDISLMSKKKEARCGSKMRCMACKKRKRMRDSDK